MIRIEFKPILPSIAREWIEEKHYSHKAPNVMYPFGLFYDNKLKGIITFGVSNTPHNDFICGNISVGKVLELNRVVIDNDAPLNSGSQIISKALKWLKLYSQFKIIISYSDLKYHHYGYLYQASNFLYIGTSKGSAKRVVSGFHPRTVSSNTEGVSKWDKDHIRTSDKHRYIKFIGNKKENKEFLKHLKYRVMNYPKAIVKPKRYESLKKKGVQNKLF